jgi:hypothetical protein
MSSKKNTCILTTYFSIKKHPQHLDPNNIITGLNKHGFIEPNNFDYIKNFYNSVLNKECDVYIFHDNLSKDFLDKYQKNNITFLKVNPSKLSNNDSRFFHYHNFLHKNFYEKVFLSDVCDVLVARDPSIMKIDFDIYFCRDLIDMKQYGFSGKSFTEICRNLSIDISDLNLNQPMLNMGVIGFNYENSMKFLFKFCSQRLKSGFISENVNMTLGNFIARKYFNKIYSGEPFCSEFKKYQTDRKDVYFIHK